jgi:ankyrin repeat protein
MASAAKRKKVPEAYPLHAAAKRGRPEEVRQILEADDAPAVDAKDAYGFTAFALACRSQQVG